MRSKFKGKRAGAFWDLVVKSGISLISSSESPDSNVTPEEAAQFLVETKEKQRAEPEKAAPVSEADDLVCPPDSLSSTFFLVFDLLLFPFLLQLLS